MLQEAFFRKFKSQLALALSTFTNELSTLVRTACLASSAAAQAAFARFVCRALGAGGGMAYILIPPIVSALEEAYAELQRTRKVSGTARAQAATLQKLHGLLCIAVSALRQPMGKALMLESGAAGLLGNSLHEVLEAWNDAQERGAETRDHRAAARLATEAIRAACNAQVCFLCGRP